MRIHSAIEATLAIRATLPAEEQAIFDAELAARLGIAGAAGGTMAVGEAVEIREVRGYAPVTIEAPETELEQRLPDFLNPSVELDVSDQLATMKEFWSALNVHVPELDAEQEATLESVLAANPDRRVVPSPLLDLNGRKQIAEDAKVSFGKADLHARPEAFWTPDEQWVFSKLLDDPESTIEEGKASYVLGYKTPAGEVVGGREAYKAALIESGKAVVANDGTVWVFPVMDVQIRAPRTLDSAGHLYDKVSATATPESHITMHLLQHANGTPSPDWEPDFVNEAVYEIDKKGKLIAPVGIACVDRFPLNRQVCLGFWHVDYRYDVRFGVRREVSGI